MNRLQLFMLFASLTLIGTNNVDAQCSNFEANYPSGVFSAPDNWHYNITHCAYAGEFSRYEVVEGAIYNFMTCWNTQFDSEITLWDESHSSVLAYETDNCSGNQGLISWTATYTGEAHLLVSATGCQSNTSCARIIYRRLSSPLPPTNNVSCFASTIEVTPQSDYTQVVIMGATNSNIPAPSCGNYMGSDVWYSAVVPQSGALSIMTQAGSIRDAVMTLYTGDCSALSEVACSDDVNGFMPAIDHYGLVPGSTVYIRLHTYGNQEEGMMGLGITELCSGPPSNDLICDAELITVGSTVSGTNECATDIDEIWVPSCFTTGSINSVWYAFEAPSGGSIRATTAPIGDFSTQISIMSGPCDSMSELVCNRDTGEGCGTVGASSVVATGLTPGQTYYILVDGKDDKEGEFNLTLSSLINPSPQTGSDCESPIELCSDYIYFADPGPQGTGVFCDFDGQGNCTGGERNSIWYQFEVGANGDIEFVIAPNDASASSCVTETDYDFLLWKVSGQGATADCSSISVNPELGLVACNYSNLGVTGLSPGGNTPAPYSGCFDSAFEPSITATAGDVYLLVIQNYQGSTSGFTIDFTASDSDVVSGATPNTLYWSGGQAQGWDESENWGNCGFLPSCLISAVIPASAANHPIVSGEHYVHDLIIEPGAHLELAANCKLHVCGDFINHGTIDASPSSSMLIDNTSVNQALEGNLTGNNALGNLIIEKSGGIVNMNSSLAVAGNFTTANASSCLHVQGNEMLLGGNFQNSNGTNTFTGHGSTGKLTFNGSVSQQYHQGASKLNLNHVEIDNTGGGLELLTDLRVKNNTGKVQLTNGIIHTGPRKVFIRNEEANALNAGNPSSYIEGKLLRYTSQSGLFHFPVGHAATGYQRADVNFTSHNHEFITATHSPWSTLPAGLNVTEFNCIYNLDALDNGFFTLTADRNPADAEYNMSLYNYAYGNNIGAQGWTVMKDSGSGWFLDGDCEVSTVDQVHRSGLSGFSRFGTAQSSTSLPIELLTFEGSAESRGNHLRWITASEIDNDRFELESSRDAVQFELITTLSGAGQSSTQQYYEFLDETPASGLTYYRLRQVDFDGEMTLSNTLALERELVQIEFEIYPNPAESELYIEALNTQSSIGEVILHDPLGRSLLRQKWPSSGEHSSRLRLSVADLKAGVYMLSVYNLEGIVIEQLQVVKH